MAGQSSKSFVVGAALGRLDGIILVPLKVVAHLVLVPLKLVVHGEGACDEIDVSMKDGLADGSDDGLAEGRALGIAVGTRLESMDGRAMMAANRSAIVTPASMMRIAQSFDTFLPSLRASPSRDLRPTPSLQSVYRLLLAILICWDRGRCLLTKGARGEIWRKRERYSWRPTKPTSLFAKQPLK